MELTTVQKIIFSIIFLAMAGCKSDGKPLIQMIDKDKGNTSIHGDPKPLYREITDEFGLRKGWEF